MGWFLMQIYRSALKSADITISFCDTIGLEGKENVTDHLCSLLFPPIERDILVITDNFAAFLRELNALTVKYGIVIEPDDNWILLREFGNDLGSVFTLNWNSDKNMYWNKEDY